MDQLYQHLERFAKNSIFEIFNEKILEVGGNGKSYVLDGTNCDSFGILKAKVNEIKFKHLKSKSKIQTRLILTDESGKYADSVWKIL